LLAVEDNVSLPPSDLSMLGYSLAGVTTSSIDVDTQVIVDLLKGQTDSARSDSKDILGTPHSLTAYLTMIYGHLLEMDTQPTCPSLDADTIESFPMESPVSHDDDIRSETISPREAGNMRTNASDAMLDCDCRVSVQRGSCFRILFAERFILHRLMIIASYVKGNARGGTTFGA
jgi:hypothetical protein